MRTVVLQVFREYDVPVWIEATLQSVREWASGRGCERGGWDAADYVAEHQWEASQRYSIGATDWYHSSAATYDWGYTDTADSRLFAPVTSESEPAGGAGNDTLWGAVMTSSWAGRVTTPS